MGERVHLLWTFLSETRWGETHCGFRGTYRDDLAHLVFSASGNRDVGTFHATTAVCEVTCGKCRRYVFSLVKEDK